MTRRGLWQGWGAVEFVSFSPGRRCRAAADEGDQHRGTGIYPSPGLRPPSPRGRGNVVTSHLPHPWGSGPTRSGGSMGPSVSEGAWPSACGGPSVSPWRAIHLPTLWGGKGALSFFFPTRGEVGRRAAAGRWGRALARGRGLPPAAAPPSRPGGRSTSPLCGEEKARSPFSSPPCGEVGRRAAAGRWGRASARGAWHSAWGPPSRPHGRSTLPLCGEEKRAWG